MTGIAEYPFEGKFYTYFYKKEGRIRIVISNKGKKNVYMNYARYLMCVKEGRILDEAEQVHHIDENKLNDSLDNLQILSDVEHGKLHHTEKQFINLECFFCGKKFIRQMKCFNVSLKLNSDTFCSRSCNTKNRNRSKLIKKVPIQFGIK